MADSLLFPTELLAHASASHGLLVILTKYGSKGGHVRILRRCGPRSRVGLSRTSSRAGGRDDVIAFVVVGPGAGSGGARAKRQDGLRLRRGNGRDIITVIFDVVLVSVGLGASGAARASDYTTLGTGRTREGRTGSSRVDGRNDFSAVALLLHVVGILLLEVGVDVLHFLVADRVGLLDAPSAAFDNGRRQDDAFGAGPVPLLGFAESNPVLSKNAFISHIAR
ncbi:hypothetical protein PG993_005930 [Apiospora rasikravindrae]|uniref:Uncharacterized protein n=1 Tax=Apiospora rasikravindrae TaxID=990691 RepID=A0ABR1TA55_9PEZI